MHIRFDFVKKWQNDLGDTPPEIPQLNEREICDSNTGLKYREEQSNRARRL